MWHVIDQPNSKEKKKKETFGKLVVFSFMGSLWYKDQNWIHTFLCGENEDHSEEAGSAAFVYPCLLSAAVTEYQRLGGSWSISLNTGRSRAPCLLSRGLAHHCGMGMGSEHRQGRQRRPRCPPATNLSCSKGTDPFKSTEISWPFQTSYL